MVGRLLAGVACDFDLGGKVAIVFQFDWRRDQIGL